MNKILIVEDNENFRKMLELNFDKANLAFESCASAEEAFDVFNRDIFSVGVFDLKLPEMGGLELLTRVLEVAPEFPVFIVTAYGDIETAVEAVKKGASDFIQKPFDPDFLIDKIKKEIKKRSFPSKRQIVGNAALLKEAIALGKKVAVTDLTAFLFGESGTGKELFARAIHDWSPRKEAPFVVLNSAAIPETLLESELFGIEKGTATGVSKRIGKISQASGGTLFFDEIGDMPLLLQSKILRVIEGKEFEKVGGREKLEADVRIVCATNRDLEALVEKRKFREDLYYRLNVFPIHLPPLKDRLEDIEVLVKHFIDLYGGSIPGKVKSFSGGAFMKLKQHEWKGNVRELENVVKRALIICDGDVIGEDDIVFHGKRKEDKRIEGLSLREVGERAKKEIEIKIIREALRQTEGNKAQAARLLNISYKTLFNKLNEYDLEK
ncbi:sigma-54-dependent Fis family transcriptional regulator [candidate division WOR-3 bacterium]|nr:sigma-54-dependent Fis family transcriptional regulator [candidate division WOR-3 bacterium]